MAAAEKLSLLGTYLDVIEDNDGVDYGIRNGAVIQAVALALRMGFAAGFRFDPTEPEWPVAYIELPTGQVSWHLPQHPLPWDGHSNEEKYRRCQEARKDWR